MSLKRARFEAGGGAVRVSTAAASSARDATRAPIACASAINGRQFSRAAVENVRGSAASTSGSARVFSAANACICARSVPTSSGTTPRLRPTRGAPAGAGAIGTTIARTRTSSGNATPVAIQAGAKHEARPALLRFVRAVRNVPSRNAPAAIRVRMSRR